MWTCRCSRAISFRKNKKTPESELKSLEKEIEDIKSQKLLNEYHLKLATYLDQYVHADKNKKVKKIKKGMNNYVTSEGIIDKNEILVYGFYMFEIVKSK